MPLRRCEAIHSAVCQDVDFFVACAPLRKRFAFVAGNDGAIKFIRHSCSASSGRLTDDFAVLDDEVIMDGTPTSA
jgi:hypothetical protein